MDMIAWKGWQSSRHHRRKKPIKNFSKKIIMNIWDTFSVPMMDVLPSRLHTPPCNSKPLSKTWRKKIPKTFPKKYRFWLNRNLAVDCNRHRATAFQGFHERALGNCCQHCLPCKVYLQYYIERSNDLLHAHNINNILTKGKVSLLPPVVKWGK